MSDRRNKIIYFRWKFPSYF